MRYFFIFLSLTGLYTLGLTLNLDATDFRISVLRDGYIPMPTALREFMSLPGWRAAFAAVLVIGVYSIITAWAFYFGVRFILRRGWKDSYNHHKSRPRPNQNGLIQQTDDICLTCTFEIPATGIPKKALDLYPTCRDAYEIGEKMKWESRKKKFRSIFSNLGAYRKKSGRLVFTNLMPNSFVRADRKDLDFDNASKGPVDDLYRAGLEMLYRHSDWPADVGQHHAGATLLEHSVRAAENMHRYSKGHTCAAAIGIYHDMGKILAYEKTGGGFKKTTKVHDQLSVYILTNTPEFKRLPKREAGLIQDVVMYGHSDRAPIRLDRDDEFNQLKKALSFADGSAVKTEIEIANESVGSGDRFNETIKVIWSALAEININDHLSKGRHEGFTNSNHEAVFIPATNLLKEMSKHASEELSKALMLEVEYHKLKSKDLTPVLKALRYLELLVESYNGLDTDTGMYKIKSARQRFGRVIAIDKKKLFESNPKLEPLWGESKYPLVVVEVEE